MYTHVYENMKLEMEGGRGGRAPPPIILLSFHVTIQFI